MDAGQVANDCYWRSKSNLGSTGPNVQNPWLDTADFDWTYSGDPQQDINFYNWNRFFFIYCDGTGHQGYIKEPMFLRDQDTYFRGTNNTIAHLNFVFSLLPPELTDTFVVNGCSAGGLATYTWLDTIADMIHAANPAAKVFGLPDSGFFIDYPSHKTGVNDYTNNIKAVVSLANQGVALPNAKCMADNGATNPHFCLMAEHLIKYIQTPIVLEESLYDSWQLQNILYIPCFAGGWDINKCSPDEMVEINKFRDRTAELLKAAYDAAPTNRSVWAPACPFHCFSRFGEVDDPGSAPWVVPGLSTQTLGVVSHWLIYENLTGNFMDTVYWPDNQLCSGKSGSDNCPSGKQFLAQ